MYTTFQKYVFLQQKVSKCQISELQPAKMQKLSKSHFFRWLKQESLHEVALFKLGQTRKYPVSYMF